LLLVLQRVMEQGNYYIFAVQMATRYMTMCTKDNNVHMQQCIYAVGMTANSHIYVADNASLQQDEVSSFSYA